MHATINAALCRCSLLILLTLSCTALAAQGDTAAAAQNPEASEIEKSRSEQGFGDVNEAIREIERLTGQAEDLSQFETLEQRLQDIEARVAEGIDAPLDATPLQRMDQATLTAVTRFASRQLMELNQLGADMSSAISEAERLEESLLSRETSWSEAQTDARSRELPPSLADAVRRAVDLAAAGRSSASKRLARLVTLQSQALRLSDRLESLVAEADAQQQAIKSTLLEPEREPLWSMTRGLTAASVRDDLIQAQLAVQRAFEDFMDAFADRLLLHGLATIGFVLLLLSLRRNLHLQRYAGLEATKRVLARPLAVAVIISLAATQPLYPTAQVPILTINSILFLAAELVVLGVVLRVKHPARLWAAGAFLAFARLSNLLPYGTPLQRVIMLLATLGMSVLLYQTWKSIRSHPALEGWHGRKGIAVILAGFGGLVGIGALGNAAGALDLSSFIIDAVVRAYLAGLALLTLALVLRDLVTVLLSTRAPQRLRSVRYHTGTIAASIRKGIAITAGLLWVWAALAAFQLTGVLLNIVDAILGASLEIGELTISVFTILIIAFSVWIAVYASRLTRFFLDQDVLPRLDLPRGVPGAISTGTHYLIIAAAVLFGTAAAGIDFTRLAILVGALGVGIGFGLQNIVNNFISGIILLFERPIQVGDHVQIGSLMGAVKRIGIRASTVRTYEGSEVIVPNGDLISGQLINYTLSDRARRLEVRVGVAYGSDVDQVQSVLLEAIRAVDKVLEDPKPMVLFLGFGESSLDFRVLFWIADFDFSLGTGSDASVAIHKALTSAGIEIPFPQRDLHLRSVPENTTSPPFSAKPSTSG